MSYALVAGVKTKSSFGLAEFVLSGVLAFWWLSVCLMSSFIKGICTSLSILPQAEALHPIQLNQIGKPQGAHSWALAQTPDSGATNILGII